MAGILNDRALKNAVTDSDKTQTQIKEEVNAFLKKHNVKYQIGLTRLNDLVNGRVDNIKLHEGLALASVLDTFLSDFINDELLNLGSFEFNLLQFESSVAFD